MRHGDAEPLGDCRAYRGRNYPLANANRVCAPAFLVTTWTPAEGCGEPLRTATGVDDEARAVEV
jgi:hypothetical protein